MSVTPYDQITDITGLVDSGNGKTHATHAVRGFWATDIRSKDTPTFENFNASLMVDGLGIATVTNTVLWPSITGTDKNGTGLAKFYMLPVLTVPNVTANTVEINVSSKFYFWSADDKSAQILRMNFVIFIDGEDYQTDPIPAPPPTPHSNTWQSSRTPTTEAPTP